MKMTGVNTFSKKIFICVEHSEKYKIYKKIKINFEENDTNLESGIYLL